MSIKNRLIFWCQFFNHESMQEAKIYYMNIFSQNRDSLVSSYNFVFNFDGILPPRINRQKIPVYYVAQ